MLNINDVQKVYGILHEVYAVVTEIAVLNVYHLA